MKDYLNEIPKETLTLKNIEYDLKQIYKGYLTAFLFLLPFVFIWVLVAKWICEDAQHKFEYFFWAIPVIFASLPILFLVEYIKGTCNLKQRINIVSDWLVDLVDIDEVQPVGTMCLAHKVYYSFHFAKFGEYRLNAQSHECNNYKWSKMYAMSDRGIYNYSQLDDEFYLVLSNNKKPQILLIYNKKLFEFKN